MTKVSFALGFVTGALCISMFFGNQASTLVQAALPGFVELSDHVPTVPPLPTMWFKGNLLENMSVKLDGVRCENCRFKGKVELIYSGGMFELKNTVFDTPNINLELRGAALNTFILLRYLESLKPKPSPEKFPWQDPKWSINVKQRIKTDWVTPISK